MIKADLENPGPPQPESPSSQVCRRLVWFANGLLAAYVVRAAAGWFEPQASPTASLVTVSAQLVDLGFLPLVALALLHLARLLDPGDAPLQRRCRRNREARLLIALLLLLLPLQGLLGWGELHRLRQASQRDRAAVTGQLRQVRRAILAAPSLQVLEGNLQALQAPALPPELLQQPLPELKRRLLATLAMAEQRNAARSNAAQSRGIPSTDALLRRLLQTCLLALIYVFSLMGGLPELRRSLASSLRGWAQPRWGAHPRPRVDGDYFQSLSDDDSSEPP